MDFMGKVRGERHDSGTETMRQSEGIREQKLYVDRKRTEYVAVDPAIAVKIDDLLESQEDMASDDIKKMLTTADKIQGANCHKTALFLTGKYSRKQLFSPDNDKPETAGHIDIEADSTIYEDPEAFQTAIRGKQFPFRVSFFKLRNEKMFAYHSIVLLGVTNKGTLVGFEKEAAHADYHFRYIRAMDSIAGYLMNGYSAGLEK